MAAVRKEFRLGTKGIQAGRMKIATGFILGGAALVALIVLVGSQQKATGVEEAAGKQSAGGGGIQPGQIYTNPDGTAIVSTIPLYSVFKSFVSQCSPYAWNAATESQWKTVAQLCEGNFKQSQFFRGDGKYILNFSGDIFPSNSIPVTRNTMNPIKELANWIKAGGIYIDYNAYPFYHSDCQIWVPRVNAIGCANCFATFAQELGISELGTPTALTYTMRSDFDVRSTFVNFPYTYSLTLRGAMPSRNVFITCDLLYPNGRVPFVPTKAYSMFVLRAGSGFYAYSNIANNPLDYANFLKAVHNYLI